MTDRADVQPHTEPAADLRYAMELKRYGGGYAAASLIKSQIRRLRFYRIADLNSDYLARSDPKIEAYDECLACVDAWIDRTAPARTDATRRSTE